MEELEGSETYDEDSTAERAEWRLVTDAEDAYEKSVTGSLTAEGEPGRLLIRARYRTDEERLGEDVIREELGFWSGTDEPDRGDVPFETNVEEWEEKGICNVGDGDYLRVCESLLTLDAESMYAENTDSL
jgi:hypothetical protein